MSIPPALNTSLKSTPVRSADGSIDFNAARRRISAVRSRELGNGMLLGLAGASLLALGCACTAILAISAFMTPQKSARTTHPPMASTQTMTGEIR
jgi:hypothetical protein